MRRSSTGRQFLPDARMITGTSAERSRDEWLPDHLKGVFRAGRLAFGEGENLSSNPHTRGSAAASSWAAGWCHERRLGRCPHTPRRT
jgi:hypothetical protein